MSQIKPFPLYTDGTSVYFTTDGVTFTAIASAALATLSAAGLMSAAQFGALDNWVSAVSPLLDMTTTGNLVSFTVPVIRPGYYFIATQASLIFIGSYSGTASTSLVVSAGNDAGQANAIIGSSLTVTAGNVNTFAPFAPIVGVSSSAPSGSVLIDGTTEITLKWAAVTGVTTGHFKVVLRGTWIPTT